MSNPTSAPRKAASRMVPLRRRDSRPVVKKIREADVDDVAVSLRDQLVDVGEPLWDAPVLGQFLGMFGRAREHGGDLRIGHEPGERFEMNISDEACAENGNLGWWHEEDLRAEFISPERRRHGR